MSGAHVCHPISLVVKCEYAIFKTTALSLSHSLHFFCTLHSSSVRCSPYDISLNISSKLYETKNHDPKFNTVANERWFARSFGSYRCLLHNMFFRFFFIIEKGYLHSTAAHTSYIKRIYEIVQIFSLRYLQCLSFVSHKH